MRAGIGLNSKDAFLYIDRLHGISTIRMLRVACDGEVSKTPVQPATLHTGGVAVQAGNVTISYVTHTAQSALQQAENDKKLCCRCNAVHLSE